MAPCMLGDCVTSLVLSRHSKNLKQRTNRCYSSVLLGKTKDSMPSKSKSELTQKTREERPQPFWAPSVYTFLSSPVSLPYVHCASQEGCWFCLRSSLQSLDLPCSIFMGFSLLCLIYVVLPTFWTPFSYSNYLSFWFWELPCLIVLNPYFA